MTVQHIADLEPARRTAILRIAYHDIPRVISAIRDFWMPQRLKQDGCQA